MPSTSQLSYNHISLDQFIPGDPNLCSAWFIVHSMLSSNILLSTLVIGESSLTLSKLLLIGHFQLEHFISTFVMKLKVFRIRAYLDSRLWLICLMAGLDQYLAIVTPLHYHNIVNKTKLIGVCLLVWATGSASALVRNVECQDSSTLIIIRLTSSLPPVTWCIVASLKKARTFLAKVIRLPASFTWYSSPLSHSLHSYLSTSGKK